jgi:hypothetical protein
MKITVMLYHCRHRVAAESNMRHYYAKRIKPMDVRNLFLKNGIVTNIIFVLEFTLTFTCNRRS